MQKALMQKASKRRLKGVQKASKRRLVQLLMVLFSAQIGDTVTLIVYMTAQSANWDLQVRECVALDSKERASLTLQDEHGCVSKPKIMSPFALTHDRKNPTILIAYSYMKAFRFPDDMQVQIKCVVAVCRDRCQNTADRCNGTTSNASPARTTTTDSFSDDNNDNESPESTTMVRRNATSAPSSRGEPASKVTKARGAFEMPLMTGFLNRQQNPRHKRGLSNEGTAAGTLPLRHIFNVISPEDIANMRNSSVIMIDALSGADNSLCVNQVMFIFLLAFLFVLVITTSVALTLVCLRNRALLRERKTAQQSLTYGLNGVAYVEARSREFWADMYDVFLRCNF